MFPPPACLRVWNSSKNRAQTRRSSSMLKVSLGGGHDTPPNPMITRFILLAYFYLKSSLCLCCSFVHICILLPVLSYCKFISLKYQCLHSITWKTLLKRNTSPAIVWYFFLCWYALFFSKECYMFLISNLLFSNPIAALRSSLGACVL